MTDITIHYLEQAADLLSNVNMDGDNREECWEFAKKIDKLLENLENLDE